MSSTSSSDDLSRSGENKELKVQSWATEADIITAHNNITTKEGNVISKEESDNSSSTNIFKDPEVAAYYRKIYDEANYECRHLFDPEFEWTTQEENRLIRKLDWRICLWGCVMFFALQVDRGNVVQAVGDNMLKNLKLSTNDYNYGNTVFYVSFLLAELPSQLVSKKMGPDRWIPIQIVLWSVVSMTQVALSGRKSFLVTRALLGVLQGGFIPDMVLWFSYFYTSRELPIRLSFFWSSMSITIIVTSLLAFAIFHLEGLNGWEGWRWLFLLEGIVTLTVGLASFFLMPASAVETKSWFCPQGWFSDREEKILVNRILRDDPSKGDMHNRKAISPKLLWHALCKYDLWPIYAIGLVCFIPQGPPTLYITLTLRSLGFDAFKTTLLTIPPTVIHMVTMLGITYLSDFFKERSLVGSLQSWWTLPCLIALRFWPGLLEATKAGQWGTYAIVCVLVSYPYCHAINVGWASRNSNTVRTRTVSTAVYNMFVQLGSIIATGIYRADDAPKYHRGNSQLIIINVVAIGTFLFAKLYYVLRNKARARRWTALSAEEKLRYVQTTTDQGSKRLDFRFTH